METSQTTDNEYCQTVLSVVVAMYILLPSDLKNMPFGEPPSLPTYLYLLSYSAVEMSQATDNEYWKTESSYIATMYILVPSGLKNMPIAIEVCPTGSKLLPS
ncbi:hypothetical protein ES705_47216 [subsurface metagenome]